MASSLPSLSFSAAELLLVFLDLSIISLSFPALAASVISFVLVLKSTNYLFLILTFQGSWMLLFVAFFLQLLASVFFFPHAFQYEYFCLLVLTGLTATSEFGFKGPAVGACTSLD